MSAPDGHIAHGAKKLFQGTVTARKQMNDICLPRKHVICLEHTTKIGRKHFTQLTTRLIRNDNLICGAVTIVNNSETRIAELVSEAEIKNRLYCTLHQKVMRESRTITKLCVVFEASSHTGKAKFLNECVQSGPKVKPDIVTLLLIFRAQLIVLVAGLEKRIRM